MSRKALPVLALLLLLALLTSCADLGDYQDEEEYYATFGEFVMLPSGITSGAQLASCNVNEIYCKESTDHFATPFYEGKYRYAVVQVQRDIKMDDFALWLCTTGSTVTVTASLYVLDTFNSSYFYNDTYDAFYGTYLLNPSSVPKGSPELSALTSVTIDGKGTVRVGSNATAYTKTTGKINFSLPVTGEGKSYTADVTATLSSDGKTLTLEVKNTATENVDTLLYTFKSGSDASEKEIGWMSIGQTSVYLSTGEWSAMMLDTFTVGSEICDTVEVKAGQYILVKFENNGSSYARNGYAPASFNVTNLMVRAE